MLCALWLCMALFVTQAAHATCNRTDNLYVQTTDLAIIKLRFGHINLSDSDLQPNGSVLASIVSPSTDYAWMNPTADTVLWECDKGDNIQFLVANNADWVYGGWHEIGQADNLQNVYATGIDNVGLQLSMAGTVLSQYWQPVPVKTWREFSVKNPVTGKMVDKIAIRLGDVPAMEAKLYKVKTKISDIFPTNTIYPGCNVRAARILYVCIEPDGYIQLDGPGILHDYAGEWARTRYRFYGVNNGLVWGMYRSLSFSRVPTCLVKSATPNVHFALQVSQGAFAAAQELGLVNPDNGVEYLLSDQYGKDPTLAKGVGITLYNERDQRRRFIGQPGLVGSGYPRGANAGWYSVLQGAVPVVSDTASGIQRHQLEFTARLVKLPGAQEVTPGKVHAIAHVLVKVQ